MTLLRFTGPKGANWLSAAIYPQAPILFVWLGRRVFAFRIPFRKAA